MTIKNVAIIVPIGGVLSGIEMVRHLFNEANDYLVTLGREQLFRVKLTGATRHVSLNDGLFSVRMDATIDESGPVDLIIIPALYMDVETHLSQNEALIGWVAEQYARGAEVASLCVGAFLLAKTGLLDGRQCTTHWKAAHHFKRMFPGIALVKEKIITDEQGIYSSGGGLSMLNLMIYLVEKHAGREVAIYCAKFFQVDIERSTQTPFIIFQGQKEHSDEQIKKAQTYIESNFAGRISVDQLAEMLALGRRSLERRFKKATSNTLNEYIQRVKIEAAKKHLESGERKINDIMSEVGYSDTKAFRSSFKSITGLLPAQYRTKYNKRAVGL